MTVPPTGTVTFLFTDIEGSTPRCSEHEAAMTRAIARHDEIGAAVEAADLDDLVPLLGTRPSTWQEGDAALEQFVLADDGRHDEALVRLFHRRCWRYLMLCGPEGSAIARHNPIPDFRVD